jgi:hypothetical protein
MTNQANTREFRAGDRIIYNGQFIGTLISPCGDVKGLHWKVQWEDGAETGNVYPLADMVHANGGPGSAQRVPARISPEWKKLVQASEDLGTAVALWQNAKDAYVAKYPKDRQ